MSRLLARLRAEGGFGLIELLLAMLVLNIGLLAIIAAFQSGAVAIARASRISTASTLADSQMELYRAIKYSAIALSSTEFTAAQGVARYTSDTAYSGTQVVGSCANPPPNECRPIRSVSGPDHKSYQVFTYIVYDNPPTGRQLKKVTIVIRDAAPPYKVYARESSTFDESTGS